MGWQREARVRSASAWSLAEAGIVQCDMHRSRHPGRPRRRHRNESIHVNRTLQELRSQGLVKLKNKVLTVLDPRGLKKVAQYQANYLHLTRTEERDMEVSDRAADLVSPSSVDKVKST